MRERERERERESRGSSARGETSKARKRATRLINLNGGGIR